MMDFIADKFVVGSQRYRIRVDCRSTGAFLWTEEEREPGQWNILDHQTSLQTSLWCAANTHTAPPANIRHPHRAAQSVINGWSRGKAPASTEPFDARLANAVNTLRNAVEEGLREDREGLCKVETTCRDMGWPELVKDEAGGSEAALQDANCTQVQESAPELYFGD